MKWLIKRIALPHGSDDPVEMRREWAKLVRAVFRLAVTAVGKRQAAQLFQEVAAIAGRGGNAEFRAAGEPISTAYSREARDSMIWNAYDALVESSPDLSEKNRVAVLTIYFGFGGRFGSTKAGVRQDIYRALRRRPRQAEQTNIIEMRTALGRWRTEHPIE